jgi:hypothetical protein
MPLIGFEETYVALGDYRVVYIGGHPGAYKTSLAFRIAWYLYKIGRIDRVITNTACVWNENLRRLKIDDPRTLRAAIILDEGGIFLKSNAVADDFLAFLRKVDSYVIVPSVKSVPSNVKSITIKCDMKLPRIGIPLVRYRTWVENKPFSRFWWRNPSEIFGIYSTSAATIDAKDISEFLKPLQKRLIEILEEEKNLVFAADDEEESEPIPPTDENPRPKKTGLREPVVEPDQDERYTELAERYSNLEGKLDQMLDLMAVDRSNGWHDEDHSNGWHDE